MATVRQYVNQMRTTQRAAAVRMGSDIGRREKGQRVISLSLLVVLGVVLKLLTDKGVLTDAELQAAFQSAREALYDEEPDEPEAPIDSGV